MSDVSPSDSGNIDVGVRFPPFERNVTCNVWLSGSVQASPAKVVSQASQDLSQWLSPLSESDATRSCPSFQNFASIKKSDTKSWLLKDTHEPDDKGLDDAYLFVLKEELSKWLKSNVKAKEEELEKSLGKASLKENSSCWLLPRLYQEKVKELPEVMENMSLSTRKDSVSNKKVFQCFKEESNSLNMSHWLVGGAH